MNKPYDSNAPRSDQVRPPVTPVPAEEVVALALNEQGFLLQQRILEEIQTPLRGALGHRWQVRAVEYPVSVGSDSDTRVDVVLTDGTLSQACWHLVLECKRSHPDYKRWVFFDRTPREPIRGDCYFVETADLGGTWAPHERPDPPMMHRVDARPAVAQCGIYNFYVETRLERPNSGKKASATDAIEDAFQQVTLGQAGLGRRLREMHNLKFRTVPVVVTTAEILVADFAATDVSLERGDLRAANLKLSPKPWVAVNYRINDTLVRQGSLTSNAGRDVAEDVFCRHLRTIFIVQAQKISPFLEWFERDFPKG